jgi:uncharacterized membrane protein YdjX (TVP38/TMEM64 family)
MTSENHWSKRKMLAWGAGIAAVLALIGFFLHQLVDREDVVDLVEYLQGYGENWWAPLALIAAFVIVSLTGIPGTPLTLTAAVVWGWMAGSAWVMAATMIGTAAPYFLARLGAPRVKKKMEERFGRISEELEEHGFTALLVMRLMHIFPFAVLSYASGFADLKPLKFFSATFLGTLPGVLAYSYFAESLLEGVISPGDATRRTLLAGLLLAIFVIGTSFAARRMRRDRE